MLSIDNKKIVYAMVVIVLTLPIVFFVDLAQQSWAFTYLAIFSLLQLGAFLLFNFLITGEVLNFSAVIVLMLFLFHFGQIILLGLFIQWTENQQITLLYFEFEECIEAYRWIYYSFSAICFGMIFFSRKKSDTAIEEEDKRDSILFIREKAKIILLFTLPIKVIVDSLFLFTALTQGQGAGTRAMYSIPDFIRSVGSLSIIGLGLLILSYREEKNKHLFISLIVIGYFVILMFSGRRSENVAYVCLFAFIFIKSTKRKISFLTVIFLGAVGYFFLIFLYSIVSTRDFDNAQSITNVGNSFVRTLKTKNIFVEVLREYGNTGYTSVCVLELWLKRYSATYGLSLIKSLAAVIPNIGGFMGKLAEEGNFAMILQKTGSVTDLYKNIGGSVIGELFFNFGYIGGVVASFVLGAVVGKCSLLIQKGLAEKNYLFIAPFIPIMCNLLYWVRDTLGGQIRLIVWGWLFMMIIDRVILRRYNPNSRVVLGGKND